jgi:hypothetical protein
LYCGARRCTALHDVVLRCTTNCSASRSVSQRVALNSNIGVLFQARRCCSLLTWPSLSSTIAPERRRTALHRAAPPCSRGVACCNASCCGPRSALQWLAVAPLPSLRAMGCTAAFFLATLHTLSPLLGERCHGAVLHRDEMHGCAGVMRRSVWCCFYFFF